MSDSSYLGAGADVERGVPDDNTTLLEVVASYERAGWTGDFGDPAKPVLGTKDFIKQIADRLGRKPKTVPAVAESEVAGVTWRKPVRPQFQEVVRTYTNVVTQVVGCDIYLDSPLSVVSLAEEMQRIAARAFDAIGGRGLARVDFFFTGSEFIVNEINTMPGFTPISMFPACWLASGLSYPDLITELIQLGLATAR